MDVVRWLKGGAKGSSGPSGPSGPISAIANHGSDHLNEEQRSAGDGAKALANPRKVAPHGFDEIVFDDRIAQWEELIDTPAQSVPDSPSAGSSFETPQTPDEQ